MTAPAHALPSAPLAALAALWRALTTPRHTPRHKKEAQR